MTQLVSPVAQLLSVGPQHPTAGLDGYPAHDWFAPARSVVLAPANGRIVKLSGHDPAAGLVDGPHGPFGWSLYLRDDTGTTWYLTHLGTRSTRLNVLVHRGQSVGTVALWPRNVTPPHVHMGVASAGA